jgi:hypothetical protein
MMFRLLSNNQVYVTLAGGTPSLGLETCKYCYCCYYYCYYYYYYNYCYVTLAG